MTARREAGSACVLCWSAMEESVSFALDVLIGRAASSDTAPVLVCRLGGSSISKPPVSVDLADERVSAGVGVSSLPSSSTVANEAGFWLAFLA